MPARIRLQRHGKKGRAFYHIVAADQRSKRDGRYIEKIGTYNPGTTPATIDLDFDRAVDWVQKGAQPTDTARAILSYKGVMLRHHLLNGVKKGAITEAEADKRFEAWLKEKEQKIQAKRDSVSKSAADAEKERLAREKAIADERAKEIASKQSELAEDEAKEAAPEGESDSAEATSDKAEGTPEAKTESAPEAKADEAEAKADASDEAKAKSEEKKSDSAEKASSDKEDESSEAKAKDEK